MNARHAWIPVALFAGVVVGMVGGVALHSVLSPAPVTVEKNVTDVVAETRLWVDSITYTGEVQSAHAGEEEVVLRATDGRYVKTGDRHDAILQLWLTAAGGDVRTTWTPSGCGDDACRVVLETRDDGVQVNATVEDPAEDWRWTLEAAETTADPINYKLDVTWSEVVVEYRETDGQEGNGQNATLSGR